METSNGSSSTVYVIGDVGGHAEEFRDELEAIGCDADEGSIPAGVWIIQVGDLVHRGPDSAGCLLLAHRLLTNGEGRYVQLVGNHEAMYLGGPAFSGFEGQVSESDAMLLSWWWERGLVHVAAAIDDGSDTGLLVTHAGLTRRRWELLGAPATAWDPSDAFTPGAMMTGWPQPTAGPVKST